MDRAVFADPPMSKEEVPRKPAEPIIAPANRPADKSLVDLLIVIVNWNAGDKLASCLRSIPSAGEGLTVRVVVLDNASTDGSCEMVEGTFPDLEVMRSRENLGYARANNQVLKRYADSARFVLLLNPDTVVAPDTFRRMLDFLEANSRAGIVGCRIVTPRGTLDWACKRAFLTPSLMFYKALRLDKLLPKSPRFGRYQLTYLDENQIHEVDSVVGAFMMIRHECLQAVGLLDDSYFMYGEDIDLCYRAKEAGWKVFYVPTATVLHHKGESTRRYSYRMIHLWYESTWKFYRRRIGPNYSAAVNALVWSGLQVMCATSLAANFLRREKRVPSRR